MDIDILIQANNTGDFIKALNRIAELVKDNKTSGVGAMKGWNYVFQITEPSKETPK